MERLVELDFASWTIAARADIALRPLRDALCLRAVTAPLTTFAIVGRIRATMPTRKSRVALSQLAWGSAH